MAVAEYIEREAALRALCEAVHAKDGNIPCRNQLVSCSWAGTRTQDYAEKILAIPAADVAPVRHGRWIKYSPHNSDMLTCSECEKYWILDGEQYDFRYCPNCGALMDKDGDGE